MIINCHRPLLLLLTVTEELLSLNANDYRLSPTPFIAFINDMGIPSKTLLRAS